MYTDSQVYTQNATLLFYIIWKFKEIFEENKSETND